MGVLFLAMLPFLLLLRQSKPSAPTPEPAEPSLETYEPEAWQLEEKEDELLAVH